MIIAMPSGDDTGGKISGNRAGESQCQDLVCVELPVFEFLQEELQEHGYGEV